MAINSDGLFGKANEAAEKWNTAVEEESSEINSLFEKMEEVMYGYNKPYELEGFTHIKGTWDTGYVIQDAKGNQYVWVPVPDYGVFVADEDFRADLDSYYNYSGPIKDDNDAWIYYDDEEDAEYQNMLKSVKKYGGFYVGAYEACYGKDGEAWSQPHTAISNRTWSSPAEPLEEKMLWNSATYEEAQQACSAFEVLGCTTGLMYGKQWDAVCRFIANYGDKKSLENYSYNETLNAWGALQGNNEGGTTNYSSPIPSVKEKFKANNIYNLLGNLWEWTSEITDGKRVLRGSGYTSYHGVTLRSWAATVYPETGFRSAIWKQV